MERIKPNTRQGGDRKSEEFKTNLIRFDSYTSQAASDIGKSKRTIEQSIYIGEKLIPKVKEKLVELGVGKTKALEVARKAPEEQMAYVKALEEKPETVTIEAKERMNEYSIGRAEKAKTDPVRQKRRLRRNSLKC